jgi:hypothetical protein
MLRKLFARAWRHCAAAYRPVNTICPVVHGGPLLGLPLLKLVSVSNSKSFLPRGASLRLALFLGLVPVLVDASTRGTIARTKRVE